MRLELIREGFSCLAWKPLHHVKHPHSGRVSNLLILLRCDTGPNEWGIQWDPNTHLPVYYTSLLTLTLPEVSHCGGVQNFPLVRIAYKEFNYTYPNVTIIINERLIQIYSPFRFGYRISQMYLFSGVRQPHHSWYDAKLFVNEIPALELWVIWSIHSLPLLYPQW